MEFCNALNDLEPRIVVCLLMKDRQLVKTKAFRDPRYVGDPLNAVRVFNEKLVDELVLLDIGASREGKPPEFELIGRLARECQMPFAYGGGVKSVQDFERLISLGVEKVIISHAAVIDPTLISGASQVVGSQSVVVCIDISHRIDSPNDYEVTTLGNKLRTGLDAYEYAQKVQGLGAGEILLSNADNDGRRCGLDLTVVHRFLSAVDIPLTIVGGAGSYSDLFEAVMLFGTIGIGAGSIFIYQGRFDAVLLQYPVLDLKREMYKRSGIDSHSDFNLP